MRWHFGRIIGSVDESHVVGQQSHQLLSYYQQVDLTDKGNTFNAINLVLLPATLIVAVRPATNIFQSDLCF